MSELQMEEFLNHKGSSTGGRYLNWTKQGRTEIVLPPKSLIHAIWNHRWYWVREVDSDGTKERRVFGRKFNCHEHEYVCRKATYRTNKGNGPREVMPEICPMDLMIECVHKMVAVGDLGWTDVVFKFEGDNPKDEYNIEITAGGLYAAFNRKELTVEQKADMRKAGIRRDEAFRQDARVKLNYLFTVCADAQEGLQLAFEGKTIGEKMKVQIAKAIKAVGRELGHPSANTYPFEWTYDEAAEFDNKYDVTAMTGKKVDAAILEVLQRPLPDTSEETRKGDCLWLLENFKEHCVLKDGLPWDEIFGPAKKAGLLEKAEAPEEDDIPDIGPDVDDEPAANANEKFECEHCNEPTLLADSTDCSSCGALFDGPTLIARPCMHEGCKAIVPISKEPRSICPKCGTTYDSALMQKPGIEAARAAIVSEPKAEAAAPAAAPARRMRSQISKPAEAPKVEVVKDGDRSKSDNIPFS